jgi:hypothetical protein
VVHRGILDLRGQAVEQAGDQGHVTRTASTVATWRASVETRWVGPDDEVTVAIEGLGEVRARFAR